MAVVVSPLVVSKVVTGVSNLEVALGYIKGHFSLGGKVKKDQSYILVVKHWPLKANLCEFFPWNSTNVACMGSYEDWIKTHLNK